MNSRHSLDWNHEQVQQLKDMIDKKLYNQTMAIRLGTTSRAISAKRARLGLYVKPHLRNTFEWTDERHDELRRLVKLKMSNNDIADRFGVSKNSIIGKKARLGLSEKTRRIYKSQRPPKPPKIQQSALRSPEEPAEPLSPSGVSFHPEHPESSPTPSSEPHVANIGHHSRCRYPTGSYKTGDLTWCGEPAQAKSSYCPEHHKLCHAPTRKHVIITAGIRQWR